MSRTFSCLVDQKWPDTSPCWQRLGRPRSLASSAVLTTRAPLTQADTKRKASGPFRAEPMRFIDLDDPSGPSMAFSVERTSGRGRTRRNNLLGHGIGIGGKMTFGTPLVIEAKRRNLTDRTKDPVLSCSWSSRFLPVEFNTCESRIGYRRRGASTSDRGTEQDLLKPCVCALVCMVARRFKERS